MTGSDSSKSLLDAMPASSIPEPNCEKLNDAKNIETNSFEIPRPLLTIQQAAAFLGKSVRALERSLMGRWGNKLPEGWNAKKVKTEQGEEWRIVPPPGFRVRSYAYANETKKEDGSPPDIYTESHAVYKRGLARTEHNLDQTTIVIDRSDEVETLLRELLVTQKALSEERRLHMEDIRMLAQVQGSIRLLESSASENSRAKIELEATKRELEELKREYNSLVDLPWWKRFFALRKV